ncbi:MAG TPA: TlpA disulfide reductase family protein [Terriglobia bacterium]|nr:TlpA disulfide reductase family protein [Terriglobia bacterium]
MTNAGLSFALALGVATAMAAAQTETPVNPGTELQAETRVVDYVRDHLQPGKPLLVSDLYNNVFTAPAERQALDKLYRAFFRVPLFVAHYQERFGHPPTLAIIAQQFDLHAPGAADVLLRVMESDPRVPKFLTRDPKNGEIASVDLAEIRSDPRFGQELEHQLTGREGRPAPPFDLPGVNGANVDSAALAGKVLLLYVWFTGCPPCMKESPVLVGLDHEFKSKGLVIVGANADRVLGLSYTDAVRQHYLTEHRINFPVGHWTGEANTAYGGVAIFPTLFLIDGKGVIRRQWVGFASADELRRAVEKVVG